MQRDMDLVRKILIESAESNEELDARAFASDKYPIELVFYHAEMMDERGLIKANIVRSDSGIILVRINSLTWEGNDFLDAVRSDKVWGKVKMTIAKTVGSASFDTVKALAVKTATDLLMQ